MPNLAGIWGPGLAEGDVRRTVSQQLRRIRVPAVAYEEYCFTAPGIGIGLLDHGVFENGSQPAQSEDGNLTLFLDGEIINCDELKVQFHRDLTSRCLTPPHVCLHLLRQYGGEVALHFDGQFCIVLHDRSAGRLTVISDRYGVRPLFYVERRGMFLFGTELKALAVVDPGPRAIDEAGTLELFSYRAQFMGRTWMRDYCRISPATIMTVGPEGTRTRQYWTYGYDESAPTLDQETYVTLFATLLDRATERSMRGRHRIGIFLSGGYDSRSVAASIRTHHRPIPAFTFGYPESRDVRYAAQLAARLGLEHVVLNERGPYLYPNCRAIVWRTEGMLPFCETTSLRYHPAIQAKVDIILTGFLGEFGGSHTWPQLLLARSRTGAMKAIYERFLTNRLALVRRLFQKSFFERVFSEVRERFERSFDSVRNDHPMNVADAWNRMHLQPRLTWQAPSVDRYLFEIRAPHMDKDLVDFLLTIPPMARLEQRVYKKMIAYRFPEIRDIPCTNSGRPIDPHFPFEYAKMAARFIGRKVSQPLAGRFSKQGALGREFRDLDEEFRAEPKLYSALLRPMMKAGTFPNEMFDHTGIEALIQEQEQRRGNHAQLLSLLISWGLAVRYFLYDDLSEAPASQLTQ